MKTNNKKPNKKVQSLFPHGIPMFQTFWDSIAAGNGPDFVNQIGLQTIREILELEIEELAGPKYKHKEADKYPAYRWGTTNSRLAFGGQKASLKRPRVRARATKKEMELKSLQKLGETKLLLQRAWVQAILGVSNRKYKRSLENEGILEKAYGASKSSVSRNFIAISQRKMEEWLSRKLEKNIPILMIDGIGFKGRLVIGVLGIKPDGQKQVLGVRDGNSENANVCKDLLNDLLDRGLDKESVKLVIIDGSKALASAIRDIFGDKILIQRCQIHKLRNVKDYLSEKESDWVIPIMHQAYEQTDYLQAKTILENLAKNLRKSGNTSAAKSIEEGLEETLTVIRINCPKSVRKSLSSTNIIENVNGSIRRVSKRVRRWRDGDMIRRWVVSSILEAERGFRRIRGYKELPILLERINRNSILEEKIA